MSYILETSKEVLNVREYTSSTTLVIFNKATKQSDFTDFTNIEDCWLHLSSIGYSEVQFSQIPF